MKGRNARHHTNKSWRSWKYVKNHMHDTSGVARVEGWWWEEYMGVWYPIQKIRELD